MIPMNELDKTLTERGKTHGDFEMQGAVSQRLKGIMRRAPNYQGLSAPQVEALEMILHKVSRILCGEMSKEQAALNSAFLQYPAAAEFGKVIPKAKIYKRSGANTRLKDLFVEQVEQIVWQYKLAPETIRLPARPGAPEIQIFTIQLREPELHQDVLRSIDRAIPFPIVFELTFEGKTQIIAAYKRPNKANTSRWVLSDYFASNWWPIDSKRSAIPVALHLGSLYEQLLQRLIPLPARPQETLIELIARVEQVQAKQRELDRITARLTKEKQFNRKVEINATLRKLKTELNSLR